MDAGSLNKIICNTALQVRLWPPIRMRPHQRINRNAHTPRINIRVSQTLLHHHFIPSHDTAIAKSAPDIYLVVSEVTANAGSRPIGPESIVPHGLAVGFLVWLLGCSACSMAAGRVAVEGYDAHLWRWSIGCVLSWGWDGILFAGMFQRLGRGWL
jgi:hypothetical protein